MASALPDHTSQTPPPIHFPHPQVSPGAIAEPRERPKENLASLSAIRCNPGKI